MHKSIIYIKILLKFGFIEENDTAIYQIKGQNGTIICYEPQPNFPILSIQIDVCNNPNRISRYIPEKLLEILAVQQGRCREFYDMWIDCSDAEEKSFQFGCILGIGGGDFRMSLTIDSEKSLFVNHLAQERIGCR